MSYYRDVSVVDVLYRSCSRWPETAEGASWLWSQHEFQAKLQTEAARRGRRQLVFSLLSITDRAYIGIPFMILGRRK